MTDPLVTDLTAYLGSDRVTDADADRSAYAHDLWPRQLLATRGGAPRPVGPRAVVWPVNTDELTALIGFARRHGVGLVPFGAGSGVTGGIAAGRDTVAVDLKRMRTLHSVDLAAGTCTADAGVLGEHLEEKLRRRGATLGHFPSSIYCSTLGGWVVTRSAGQCSGRYGKIEDMTLALEGVLGTGEVFHAGAPTPGAVDTRALLVGSEGTCGFVTRATLRVWPAPTSWQGLAFTFGSMSAGWTAIRRMYQSGLRPAVTRLYDPFDSWLFQRGDDNGGQAGKKSHGGSGALAEVILRRVLNVPDAVNLLAHTFGALVGGRSLLIVGFEGTDTEPMSEALARARRLCADTDGRDLGDGLARRWVARRHAVSYRQAPAYARGLWADTMEVAAPWSRLGELHGAVREALGHGGFVMAHMSHAYPDGCAIYFTFVGASPTDPQAIENYDRTWTAALTAAHAAGGTVAHHHGVGRSKRQAMGLEWGAGVALLRALRDSADPDGVFARGALVPTVQDTLAGGVTRPAEGDGVRVDETSRLVSAAVDTPRGVVAAAAAKHGLTVPWPTTEGTVGTWLAEGMPGWSYADPVDHPIAGWRARLPSGGIARWVPAPRRSAGPDVLTLLVADKRFGALESVTLRGRGEDETGPAWTAPYASAPERDDPVLGAWIDRAALAMRSG